MLSPVLFNYVLLNMFLWVGLSWQWCNLGYKETPKWSFSRTLCASENPKKWLWCSKWPTTTARLLIYAVAALSSTLCSNNLLHFIIIAICCQFLLRCKYKLCRYPKALLDTLRPDILTCSHPKTKPASQTVPERPEASLPHSPYLRICFARHDRF
jgi:hypothetical protein